MEPTTKTRISTSEWIERILLALLFIAIGGATMIFFNPWTAQRFTNPGENYLWRIGFSLFLLVLALLVHRSQHLGKYWLIFFGLFTLQAAVSLDWILANFLLDTLHVSDSTPAGWTLQKLNDFLVIVAAVILFTKVSGESLGSIYIQKGNLKQGFLIGGIALLVCLAGSIPMSELMFGGRNLTIARVLPWMPRILIIVLANAALEEILFRGVFLRKLQPFFGRFLANLLIAFVFTGLHLGATYTPQQMIFLAIVFPLALAWGYIMQKTDAVWASIIFHAGTDIPIFLGIFSALS
jgi:membrane protease YdiL (CAAX protease family)